MGGLGNQMFQYALYKSLNLKGHNAKLDKSWYLRNNSHNGYELEKIFNISPNYATDIQCKQFADINTNIFYGIKRKIFPKKTHYFEKNTFNYDKNVFNVDFGYFEGYWQNDEYFKDIRKELLNEFVFKNLDQRNMDFSRYLRSINSVSIHVRRGDYISNPKALKIYGNICDLKYYLGAISEINKKLNDVKFIIFSDDISWCKHNLKLNDPTFVDWNIGITSYQDMYLMSNCKHNIIANSSFSWWGAWLNRNPEKMVFAPKKWVNDRQNVNIVPKGWIKIE